MSSYWVKYPERYNPGGKAPSDLWHYPIPVQGSWSRNGIRHFCPFPLGMVARMIALTTQKGDVVLDPFAGTGTVMTVAGFLGRRALGVDVNRAFPRTFGKKGYDALLAVTKKEVAGPGHENSGNGLSKLIVRLRMLKYPKTLFGELLRPDRLGKTAREQIAAFVVTPLASVAGKRPEDDEVVGRIAVQVLATDKANLVKLREAIRAVTSKPPLSKFGLEVVIKVVGARVWKPAQFADRLPGKRWYIYTKGAFHAHAGMVPPNRVPAILRDARQNLRHRIPPILASMGVSVPLAVQ
jgi:DNA methylase